MITRDALDKVKDKLLNDSYCATTGEFATYAQGFDAAVSLLWPVTEAAIIEAQEQTQDSPELKYALSELKEKLK